jgi:hypothetical protein
LRHRHHRSIAKDSVSIGCHMPPAALVSLLFDGGGGGPGWGCEPGNGKRQEQGKGQGLHKGALSNSPSRPYHRPFFAQNQYLQNRNLDNQNL